MRLAQHLLMMLFIKKLYEQIAKCDDQIQSAKFRMQYTGQRKVVNAGYGLNGTYHTWSTKVKFKYMVLTEAWHNVAFTLCSGHSPYVWTSSTPHYAKPNVQPAKITGSITFHNPYGFLPAEMYGLLPFEVS